MPEGGFEGGSTYAGNYIEKEMAKNPQFRPEQQLKVGGKFEGVSKYGDDYYDKGRAEKRDKAQFPHNQIMPEGGFEGSSTYAGNYIEKEMMKNPQFRP